MTDNKDIYIGHLEDLLTQVEDLTIPNANTDDPISPDKALYTLERARKESMLYIKLLAGQDNHYYLELSKPVLHREHTSIYIFSAILELHQSRTRLISNIGTFLLEINETSSISSISNSAVQIQNNDVFLVHGHDEEMKLAVARTLEQLRLKPIILHDQPDRGNTLIEKFEQYANVGFAIVLLSPDDKSFHGLDDDVKPIVHDRGRQNVVLEMGFFYGKLSRSRVVVLYRKTDSFELPSDLSGIIYKVYDPEGNWRYELVNELKDAGYDVSKDSIE
jgi:predicted nucleotide-binding protein